MSHYGLVDVFRLGRIQTLIQHIHSLSQHIPSICCRSPAGVAAAPDGREGLADDVEHARQSSLPALHAPERALLYQ